MWQNYKKQQEQPGSSQGTKQNVQTMCTLASYVSIPWEGEWKVEREEKNWSSL